ncbi:MAG: gene transfer agent family protein [Aestuariivirga sp.]
MVNRHRGEIEAELGGEMRTLVLTLGALAEIEHAYGGEDLIAIAERFEKGRIKASDAIKVIGAGLRGAGETISDADVAKLSVSGGAAGYLRIVADLLKATFAGPA